MSSLGVTRGAGRICRPAELRLPPDYPKDPGFADFSRDLFQEAQEEKVVRPLCVLLGYLDNGSQEVLHIDPGNDALTALEGSVGSLELLHPCTEQPHFTKYKALFREDALNDRYRISFFLNSAYSSSPAQQSLMLNAFEVLREELLRKGHANYGDLLERGRSVVAARYEYSTQPGCQSNALWRLHGRCCAKPCCCLHIGSALRSCSV